MLLQKFQKLSRCLAKRSIKATAPGTSFPEEPELSTRGTIQLSIVEKLCGLLKDADTKVLEELDRASIGQTNVMSAPPRPRSRRGPWPPPSRRTAPSRRRRRHPCSPWRPLRPGRSPSRRRRTRTHPWIPLRRDSATGLPVVVSSRPARLRKLGYDFRVGFECSSYL